MLDYHVCVCVSVFVTKCFIALFCVHTGVLWPFHNICQLYYKTGLSNTEFIEFQMMACVWLKQRCKFCDAHCFMFRINALTAQQSVANKELTAGPSGFQPKITVLQAAWSWSLVHSSPSTCASDQCGIYTDSESKKNLIKSCLLGWPCQLWPANTAELLHANTAFYYVCLGSFIFNAKITKTKYTDDRRPLKKPTGGPDNDCLRKWGNKSTRLALKHGNKGRLMGKEYVYLIYYFITFIMYFFSIT